MKRTPAELYQLLCRMTSGELEDVLEAVNKHPDVLRNMLIEGIVNKKASGMEDN